MAPYEADAQMAYLAINGIVQVVCPPARTSFFCPLHDLTFAFRSLLNRTLELLLNLIGTRRYSTSKAVCFKLQVITEDSDMLAYGCPRVFFKMDKNGEGQEVCMADLPECRNPSFIGFTPDMFLEASLSPLLNFHLFIVALFVQFVYRKSSAELHSASV